mgnify:FL=1
MIFTTLEIFIKNEDNLTFHLQLMLTLKALNVILSEADTKNLIKRIQLYQSLNYFVIWAKYAMPFFMRINKNYCKRR